ncbi:MAG TPA: GNAT family N-acetyltransferase, partial [Motilibacteraceae bacterium]|nr:GNAT family N-acetyltransferase [Motilibacteraceae bacterium]
GLALPASAAVAAPEELAAAASLLVVGDPPVGYARVELVDGTAHLEQLSVVADEVGHGLGSALLEAACAWAVRQGHEAMTLTTYRDVPWNGPFYARRGFVEIDAAGALAAVREHERELGLDELGPRVVMRRDLRAHPPRAV